MRDQEVLRNLTVSNHPEPLSIGSKLKHMGEEFVRFDSVKVGGERQQRDESKQPQPCAVCALSLFGRG